MVPILFIDAHSILHSLLPHFFLAVVVVVVDIVIILFVRMASGYRKLCIRFVLLVDIPILNKSGQTTELFVNYPNTSA